MIQVNPFELECKHNGNVAGSSSSQSILPVSNRPAKRQLEPLASTASQAVELNCSLSNIICAKITCSSSSLTSSAPMKINLTGEFHLRNAIRYANRTELVLSSSANVSIYEASIYQIFDEK